MRLDSKTEHDLKGSLVRELLALFEGGNAHATLEEAVKDFPAKLRGEIPVGLPYSAWQLVEHLRITQRDILDFSDNGDGDYRELRWPEQYWPKESAPPNEDAWGHAIREIHSDRKAFEKLLKEADEESLTEAFPWGNGQTLLREALLIADHNAYHTGELIVLRRLLGVWKK
jgi:uncharacterized damage-inducible protein DinB